MVSAMTITAPSQVPVSVTWSFTIDLDSSDAFTETKIYLDGKQVLTAYNNGFVVIDPYNGNDVVSASLTDTLPEVASGLKLSVSYSGLPTGTHSLKVSAFKSGNPTSESTVDVQFFEPIDKTRMEEAEKKAADAQAQAAAAQQQLNETSQKLTETQSSLDTTKSELEATKSKLEETGSKLDEATGKVSTLEETSTSLSENVEGVSKELEEKQEQINKLQEGIEDLNATTQKKGEGFDITKIFETKTYEVQKEVAVDENGNPVLDENGNPVYVEEENSATGYVVGGNSSTLLSIIVGVLLGLIILGALYWKKTHEEKEPLFKPDVSDGSGHAEGYSASPDTDSEKAVNDLYSGGSGTATASQQRGFGIFSQRYNSGKSVADYAKPFGSSRPSVPSAPQRAPYVPRLGSPFGQGESAQKKAVQFEPPGWKGKFSYDPNRKLAKPYSEDEKKPFNLGDLIKKNN